MAELVKQAATAAQASGQAPRRRRKPVRVRRQRIPRMLWVPYGQDLQDLMKAARAAIEQILFPLLPRIATTSGLTPGRADAEGWMTLIETAIAAATNALGPVLVRVQSRIKEQAGRVSRKSSQELDKQFKQLLGFDLADFGSIEELVAAFEADNFALVESLVDDYFREVEGIVKRNVRAGVRAEAFAGEIEAAAQETWKRGVSRAALIARDQTNKFFGELNRVRQTEVGVEKYVWRTSQDERVRNSHLANEGLIFSWDDPPAVGHPGADYQCRCTAEPYLAELGPAFEPGDVGEDYNRRVQAQVKARREDPKKPNTPNK